MKYVLLFFGNFLHGDTDDKVDLGNKERPNIWGQYRTPRYND